MKKAFSMMECIFVITVLGILSAIAIPVISATKDSALIAAGVKNIQTLMYDFDIFHSTSGGFMRSDGDFYYFEQITNVRLKYPDEIMTLSNTAIVKRKFNNVEIGILQANKNDCLEFTLLSNDNIQVSVSANARRICRAILQNEAVKTALTQHSSKHCLPYTFSEKTKVNTNALCNTLQF